MPLPPMITAKALGAMPQFILEAAGERRLEKAFRTAGLPYQFLELREGYIPEQALATFVNEAARASGIQNIGAHWHAFLTVADYGSCGAHVLSAPSLGRALYRAARVMPLHSTTDLAWLEAGGASARFCYQFGLRHHPSYPDIGFSALGAVLSIFRHYLGADWRPCGLLLDFDKPPGANSIDALFGCPLAWNAPRLAIEFRSGVLSRTHPGGEAAVQRPVTFEDVFRESRAGPPRSFADRVTSVVLLQLHQANLSVEATARSMGLGVRTLQRQLETEGTSFRDISNAARAQRATELLRDGSLSVAGVAAELGYETSNNFSRAFKKATGLAPSRVIAARGTAA